MMDLLLVSDEGQTDLWNTIDRMNGKRKQWTLETSNLNKMKRICGGPVNPWDQVEELTVDLDSTCSLSALNVDLTSSTFSNSDALLSLPSLSNPFKQEMLSPFNSPETNREAGDQGSPRHQKSTPIPGKSTEFDAHESPSDTPGAKQGGGVDKSVCVERAGLSSVPASATVHGGNSSPQELRDPLFLATVASADQPIINTDFQYVLAAPTSIATKVGDETLTYLNQGQPYEIKLKKLGDLSEYRGKILKSIIRLSFHERRLQYMEREQMAAWEASHPGDSILEVDLPLSYGILDIQQDHSQLNTVEFLWDPTKEGGVYIKVNCISTEFTPKKHGGEKGVPFRIQVETYLQDEKIIRRLHAASCQVKVFKLKGADRKHKQDREKIQKRPRIEQEKYQCSYEVTILTDIPLTNDFDFAPPIASSQITATEPLRKQLVVGSPPLAVPKKEEPSASQETPPDSPLQVEGVGGGGGVGGVGAPGSGGGGPPRGDWGPNETSHWLQANRYLCTPGLSSFSGADLLRLSRDDLIQLAGLSDGIRLYNALHVRAVAPKLTLYVCIEPRERVYRAVYLSRLSPSELSGKICSALGLAPGQVTSLYLLGPREIRVLLTEEVLSHLSDSGIFTVQLLADGQDKFQMILKQTDAAAPAVTQQN